ncbi:MAG TPA: exonuclease domain-containing protein [Nitriliruptorales bacterium]|nr:exonuclease domain-containing protein [Nitriliruptorales bacterium]
MTFERVGAVVLADGAVPGPGGASRRAPTRRAIQQRFGDLGTPLYQVSFAVLDLETTGLSASRDRITEVGAVKVRCGELLGEFHCVVAPASRSRRR